MFKSMSALVLVCILKFYDMYPSILPSFQVSEYLSVDSSRDTNDCHLHGQSCKRSLLWLLQAAAGLERKHLQSAVQGVPGFLCHVRGHQHHIQVGTASVTPGHQWVTSYPVLRSPSRFVLHDGQKRYFEKLAIYCNHYASLIPMSFVLGKFRKHPSKEKKTQKPYTF